MPAAGQYNMRFTWLKQVLTENDTVGGHDQEEYQEAGTFWGYMKQLSATKALAFGVQDSQATCEIHIRQYPPIGPNDQLLCKDWGLLVILDGPPIYGDNEIVFPAHTTTVGAL